MKDFLNCDHVYIMDVATRKMTFHEVVEKRLQPLGIMNDCGFSTMELSTKDQTFVVRPDKTVGVNLKHVIGTSVFDINRVMIEFENGTN